MINFREVGADFRWIDIKVFDITSPGPAKEAVPAVIANPWYDDDFASPSGTLPDPSRGVHGPYSLQHIGVASFERVHARTMLEIVNTWAALLGELPETFVRRYQGVLARTVADSAAIYRLLDLGEAARHQWDAHIGQYGFHEFVIVSTKSQTVTVLVASDD